MGLKPSPIEVVLAAFSTACVVVFGLNRIGLGAWLHLAGSLSLGLYPLYSCAAAAGWLLGNVYIRRSVGLEGFDRWSICAFYLLAPVGPFFLFRAMAPMSEQLAAPLVPWFCVGIVAVFFAVPLSLKPRVSARRPRIGSRSKDDASNRDLD